MEIRAALFDLFNVLIFGNANLFFNFISKNRQKHDIPLDGFFHSPVIQIYESGQMSDSEFFQRCKEMFGLYKVSREEFFAVALSGIQPDWKMIKIRDTLKENGFKTALISNVGPCHLRHIRTNWPKVFEFDYLSLSCQCGVRKPHPRIYLDAVERLWMKTGQCFYVDDTLKFVQAFEQLENTDYRKGIGHYYNVSGNNYLPNGRLVAERRKLVNRLRELGMITLPQAGELY